MTAALDFSLDGYRDLVAGLLGHGYAIRDFTDVEADRPDVILRHDVDQCLEAACQLAEVEAAQGWRSIYFIMLRTDMYNPLSKAGTRQLRRLTHLGRDIGLHLDPALYPADLAALNAGAVAEIGVLEAALDASVSTISFHRPAAWLQGLDAPIAGRPHAYQPRFFSDIGYCSDSRGAWHHGHPLDHPAVAAGTALQLLTHAIWWVGTGAPQQRLDAVLARRERATDRELADNCSIYRSRFTSEAPA